MNFNQTDIKFLKIYNKYMYCQFVLQNKNVNGVNLAQVNIVKYKRSSLNVWKMLQIYNKIKNRLQ